MVLEGPERRQQMIEQLKKSEQPLSGSKLGKQFGISRQVVVQDIALLRAEGYDILATARGYLLNKEQDGMVSRVVLVKHTTEALEDELNTIIDDGGRVRNVIINHCIYGDLVGDLMLRTRRDVKDFVKKVEANQAHLLSLLTEGIHMHTIEAASEEILDCIERELRKKGYIIEE